MFTQRDPLQDLGQWATNPSLQQHHLKLECPQIHDVCEIPLRERKWARSCRSTLQCAISKWR